MVPSLLARAPTDHATGAVNQQRARVEEDLRVGVDGHIDEVELRLAQAQVEMLGDASHGSQTPQVAGGRKCTEGQLRLVRGASQSSSCR
jgi:hypothetical protein